MWESLPPVAAYRAVLKRSRLALVLVPLVWDLAKWGLAPALSAVGLYFARWDFAVGFDFPSSGWFARFALPPALPSVEQLGLALAPPVPLSPGPTQYVVMSLVLLADSLIKGGYLGLLNGALHEVAPTVGGFGRSARRFGLRLFLIALLWMGYSVGVGTLAERGILPGYLVVPLNLAVVVLLAVSEFVTVVDDVWPLQAVLGAPFLLWEHAGGALAAAALSGVTTVLLTGVTSAAGIRSVLVLAPLQAVLGTWVAATALQAFQSGISTRADHESVSWVCPGCGVNNHPQSQTCVACGAVYADPAAPS